MTEADGGDGGGDVLHGVVDGEAGGDGAAGGVDVEGDGFGRVFGFEEEELGDDGGREGFFYGAVEADDAFFEEAGEDVVCKLLAMGLIQGEGVFRTYKYAIHRRRSLLRRAWVMMNWVGPAEEWHCGSMLVGKVVCW